MNGALRVLRADLRRLLPLALAMAVVVGILVWTHPADWGTRWNSLGQHLRETVIVIGPACVVVGVWCGGSTRRAGMSELLTSTRRSDLARVALDLTGLTITLYLGLLLGAAAGAWTIVVVGGYGTWAAVGYVAGLLPAVAAYTAVGYAVGRLVPWRMAAPVAGLVTYVVLGVATYSSSHLERGLGMGRLGGTDGFALDTAALLGSSLGLLALAALALAVGAVERRAAAGRGWVVVASVAAVAAVPAVAVPGAHDPSDSLELADHATTVCTTDRGPQVCVLKEQQPALALATRQARAAIARFDEVPGSPTHAGVDTGAAPDLRMLPISTTSITPWGHLDDRYEIQVANAFGYLDPYRYCPSARRTRDDSIDGVSAYESGMEGAGQWLVGELYPTNTYSPVLDRRFAAADDEQRARFSGLVALAAQACNGSGIRAAAKVLPAVPSS